MTWLHVYDGVEELEPQPDIKSRSSVSLLVDTKPMTHMDFSYTIKALRGQKNIS